MFFGWFDAIFSFIFPILFLLFIGMFFFVNNRQHFLNQLLNEET